MAGRSTDVSAASDARTVTAGASPLPNGVTRALYIGVTGNLTVTMAKGTSVTFTAVPVGILPVQVSHVTAATATDVVALY
jgi:hypothetical protein